MNDAIDDSDDEADFSKMDLVREAFSCLIKWKIHHFFSTRATKRVPWAAGTSTPPRNTRITCRRRRHCRKPRSSTVSRCQRVSLFGFFLFFNILLFPASHNEWHCAIVQPFYFLSLSLLRKRLSTSIYMLFTVKLFCNMLTLVYVIISSQAARPVAKWASATRRPSSTASGTRSRPSSTRGREAGKGEEARRQREPEQSDYYRIDRVRVNKPEKYGVCRHIAFFRRSN